MAPTIPLWLTTYFLVLVALVAAYMAHALQTAPSDKAGLWQRFPALALVVWLVPGLLLVKTGVISPERPYPVFPLVFLTVSFTVWLSRSAVGTALSHNLSFQNLLLLQTFRIPLEWWLHRLASEGLLPSVMTYSGYNYDILTGLGALALGIAACSGKQIPTGLLAAWNALGFALLVFVVSLAILSSPVPFRIFQDQPANFLPLLWPTVWLPTFLVQIALLGHLLMWRKLKLASSPAG